MSQSFMNALLLGPKETVVARKVIRFTVYFSAVLIGLGTAVLFIPSEAIQQGIDEAVSSRWVLYGAAVISLVLLVFLWKERFWAACALVVLATGDMLLTYLDTKSLPGMIDSIQLVFFLSAAQATYYLMKGAPTPAESE